MSRMSGTPTTRRRRTIRGTALVGLLAGVAALLAACGSEPSTLVGYEVEPAPVVAGFALTDVAHGDERFELRARRGEILVVFLGFTNCPDACPTAMAEIRAALGRLGDRAQRVGVAMITVDPERDVGPVFADYVGQFVEAGRALRTDDAGELQSIVTTFGATAVTDHNHKGEVEVGHTDYTYTVDDTGTVVLTWTAEMTVDDIVNDLEILLD